MDMVAALGSVAVFVILTILVFVAIRQFWLWYLRVDERLQAARDLLAEVRAVRRHLERALPLPDSEREPEEAAGQRAAEDPLDSMDYSELMAEARRVGIELGKLPELPSKEELLQLLKDERKASA